MMNSIGLAADIGGTNARLALVENNEVRRDSIVRYANSEFPTPEAAIASYLREIGQKGCSQAVIAVAAPIEGPSVEMTNHPWTLNSSSIGRVLGSAEIRFINDFEALAHSLGKIEPERIKPVLSPKAAAPDKASRLVVGAGTGFNAAPLYFKANGLIVGAGECGHSTLPATSSTELDLWSYLARGRGRASVERALSGNGLREIYEWQCLRSGTAAAPYTSAEIAQRAGEETDPNCVATARQWVTLLGRVVGDLALIFLARGGIFLTGGVTRALSQFLDGPDFKTAFCAKGRQSKLVSEIPVHLLDDDFAALSGCAAQMR
ncbi:glucokinase [Roseibium sp.]|uniref:glucokinase n=1 Tax=Roseibium sp. TaxID=1936156 RepID=UPI003B51EC2B